MELTIDEINNLTKNNDELMARNEVLVKTLEEIRDEAVDKYADGTFSARSEALNYIIDKVNEVLQ